MNSICTLSLIKDADVVVVRFGNKYRQYNAAFEAGNVSAIGNSVTTLYTPPWYCTR